MVPYLIGSTPHSREALEEVEMGSRAEMMGDPMARADKLRLQKQVLEIPKHAFGLIVLKRQVSDLVELTKQQALTIRRLERDSLAKSDRIADIETRWVWF